MRRKKMRSDIILRQNDKPEINEDKTMNDKEKLNEYYKELDAIKAVANRAAFYSEDDIEAKDAAVYLVPRIKALTSKLLSERDEVPEPLRDEFDNIRERASRLTTILSRFVEVEGVQLTNNEELLSRVLKRSFEALILEINNVDDIIYNIYFDDSFGLDTESNLLEQARANKVLYNKILKLERDLKTLLLKMDDYLAFNYNSDLVSLRPQGTNYIEKLK